MFGAHVKLCIDDYVSVHKHIPRFERMLKKYEGRVFRGSHVKQQRISRVRKLLVNHDTAEQYIFGPNGLEADIGRLGLPLSATYVRAKATKQAEEYEYNTANTI